MIGLEVVLYILLALLVLSVVIPAVMLALIIVIKMYRTWRDEEL